MAKTSSQKNIFISVKSEFSSKEGMTNVLVQIFCKVSWDIKLPPAMRRVYTPVPGEALRACEKQSFLMRRRLLGKCY